MKQLYLIRHAKSSWATSGLADAKRPLNSRGKIDAPFMGGRLRESGVVPDLIYASPAKRARKTAEKIAKAVGYPQSAIAIEDGIYSADLGLLLEVIRKTAPQIGTLFLVGHNYVITDLAEYLTGENFGSMPTCGIVGMSFPGEDWQGVAEGTGQFLLFDYPKKHRPAV